METAQYKILLPTVSASLSVSKENAAFKRNTVRIKVNLGRRQSRGRPQFAQVYYAKKTKVDGHIFHSKGEAGRYLELKMLERAGRITNLSLQPPFPMNILGADGKVHHICTYVADFKYNIPGYPKTIVEDFKGGKITPEYRIKVKLFVVLYPEYKFIESGKAGRKYARTRRKRRKA